MMVLAYEMKDDLVDKYLKIGEPKTMKALKNL